VRHIFLSCRSAVHGAGQQRQIQIQRVGQRGDGEERGRRDPAGLDLAEGFGRDAGVDRHVHQAAFAACRAQQVAEALAALSFRDRQRHSHHGVIVIPV
jgi:hypothetical protein